MLSGTFAVAEPGSGRIRLPLAFLQCNSTSYLQPVLVTCAIEGLNVKFLCTASVATSASAANGSFDPSIQCGLQPGPLCCRQGDQLSVTVKPINCKPVTATAIKVVVAADLLHSPVPAARLQQRLLQQQCTLHLSPGVSCQVVQVFPAGATSTVYRVVPSTNIQLVTDSSSSSKPQSSPALSSPSQQSQSPGAEHTIASSSSSSSSDKSRSKSSSSSSGSGSKKCGGAPAAGPTSRSERSKSSSSSSSSKPKKKSSSRSEGAAIAASASMFDILDSLGDDQ